MYLRMHDPFFMSIAVNCKFCCCIIGCEVYNYVMKNTFVEIKKADEVLKIVYGEVYKPMEPDTDGDFMTEETIRKAAHNFMKKMRLNKIDTNHDNNLVSAMVVESFIARSDDTIFVPNSWVIGVHIEDDTIWEQVIKGDLNGFSMQGTGMSTPVDIEVEIPEFVEGQTAEAEKHVHVFIVKFDDEGGFLGGWTDEVDGHRHRILRGTATEDSSGHSHRFAFVGVTNGM